MNKICTSIEQSQKLIDLGIDENTADMCWTNHLFSALLSSWRIESTPPQEYKNLLDGFVVRGYLIEPAWSLTALMNLLPSQFTEKGECSETTYTIDIRKYALTENVDLYQIAYGNYIFYEDGNSHWKDMINTGEKENIIDAAFEMIVWLKENGKI